MLPVQKDGVPSGRAVGCRQDGFINNLPCPLCGKNLAGTLAFYGFLRVSEFTGLSLQWSDMHLDTQTISVRTRQSKTDPFRKGLTLSITSTGTSTCPVRAMHKYCSMIPREQHTGPLFSAGKFNPLTRTQLSNILRRLLQQAGYNSHSTTRIALATSAAAGLPPWLIKTMDDEDKTELDAESSIEDFRVDVDPINVDATYH